MWRARARNRQRFIAAFSQLLSINQRCGRPQRAGKREKTTKGTWTPRRVAIPISCDSSETTPICHRVPMATRKARAMHLDMRESAVARLRTPCPVATWFECRFRRAAPSACKGRLLIKTNMATIYTTPRNFCPAYDVRGSEMIQEMAKKSALGSSSIRKVICSKTPAT